MRTFRWMSWAVKGEDRIRNEYIRGSVGVAWIMDKTKENRLRWSRGEKKIGKQQARWWNGAWKEEEEGQRSSGCTGLIRELLVCAWTMWEWWSGGRGRYYSRVPFQSKRRTRLFLFRKNIATERLNPRAVYIIYERNYYYYADEKRTASIVLAVKKRALRFHRRFIAVIFSRPRLFSVQNIIFFALSLSLSLWLRSTQFRFV